MILSHKIQFDPTYKQREYFARAAGTSRFVYNWALEEWNRQYEAGEKPTANKLAAQFNAIKYEQFPWISSIHKDAHARPFVDLGKAFVGFFKKTSKRPKFHKKGRRDSFYVANDRLEIRQRKIKLPIVGWVRLTEALRFSGKIMSAVVSRTADRWFVSIAVDVGDFHKDRTADGVVGVDLGLTTLATLSTGEKIPGPKALKSNLDRLRRLSRAHSRKQKGSQNKKKSADRLARLHARIGNIRKDAIHKLTTKLCSENQAIALEDLAVENMQKNRKLARGIGDANWAEIRRQTGYKVKIYDDELKIIDRWFPSSKTCRKCKMVKTNLKLSDRIFRCDNCGHEEDRDLNASRNICTEGFSGIYAWGEEGSGVGLVADVKPRFVEPRTRPRPSLGAS